MKMRSTVNFDIEHSELQKQLNQKAAEVYKIFADSEFGVSCNILIDGFGKDEMFVVEVPPQQGIEKPHRVFADNEERILKNIERKHPELLGLSYIRYA